MTRQAALQSLEDKIKLEAGLQKSLQEIFDEITRDYANETVTLSKYDDEIEAALELHYKDVGEVFSTKITSRLPEDVKPEESELEEIAAALALYFLVRKSKQRRHIQTTTVKNIREADLLADTLINQSIAEGKPLPRREARMSSANRLSKHLRNRAGNIAATETQEIAETSKHVEVSVLSGQKPHIVEPNRNKLNVRKKWWTQGDEKVRRPPDSAFDHVSADQQEVDTNEAFYVSGEGLMYPGDTSLGASIGNIARCRCGVEYSDNDIIGIRRR